MKMKRKTKYLACRTRSILFFNEKKKKKSAYLINLSDDDGCVGYTGWGWESPGSCPHPAVTQTAPLRHQNPVVFCCTKWVPCLYIVPPFLFWNSFLSKCRENRSIVTRQSIYEILKSPLAFTIFNDNEHHCGLPYSWGFQINRKL